MGKTNYMPDENLRQKIVKYNIENDDLNILGENENSNKESLKSEITLWSKMCFGMAGAPYQMLFVTIGLFSNIYFLETVQLPPGKTMYNCLINNFQNILGI